MHGRVFETGVGFVAVGWTGRGVARFVLPRADREEAAAALGAFTATPLPPALRGLVGAVRAWARGEDASFDRFPLDLEVAPFFARVYAAARLIPHGKTRTYGQLAVALGSPGAARAVGTAMARNPVPLLVPCHRVVAAGGRLGGFSAPGGLAQKRRMLELERA